MANYRHSRAAFAVSPEGRKAAPQRPQTDEEGAYVVKKIDTHFRGAEPDGMRRSGGRRAEADVVAIPGGVHGV